MGIQDLTELLQNTEDKLSVFQNKYKLNQYDISIAEFLYLVKDFLSDEQKAELLEAEHIKKLSAHIKKSIIDFVEDDKIKLDLIKNDELVSDIDKWQILELVKTLGDNEKTKLLQDSDFLREKYGMQDYDFKDIALTLREEGKKSLLQNRDLMENQLKDYAIKEIVASLEDEETKLNMIDSYEFKSYLVKDIIQTFSHDGMKEVLLENKYGFSDYDITDIVAAMDTDSLVNFVNENKEFLEQNDVSPYRIIKQLNSERQLEFMSRFEDVELTMRREETNFSNFRGRNKTEY